MGFVLLFECIYVARQIYWRNIYYYDYKKTARVSTITIEKEFQFFSCFKLLEQSSTEFLSFFYLNCKFIVQDF